jgi:hypothetical protein
MDFVVNRMTGVSPFEAREERASTKEDLKHIRVFGCRYFYLPPPELRRRAVKMYLQAEPAIFLGWGPFQAAYIVETEEGVIKTGVHVNFLEDIWTPRGYVAIDNLDWAATDFQQLEEHDKDALALSKDVKTSVGGEGKTIEDLAIVEDLNEDLAHAESALRFGQSGAEI